jgi:hypothetical protein
MRGIDRSLVDEVWRDLATYAPGRADAEARTFLDGQRPVGTYLARTLAGQAPEVQRAAFGLVFLLFKVLEASLGRPFPEVTAERLTRAQEAMASWLDAQQVPALAALEAHGAGHPTLVRYVIGVFYGDAADDPAGGAALAPDPGAAPYDAGVRARLTLVLWTLASALDLGEAEGGG